MKPIDSSAFRKVQSQTVGKQKTGANGEDASDQFFSARTVDELGDGPVLGREISIEKRN